MWILGGKSYHLEIMVGLGHVLLVSCLIFISAGYFSFSHQFLLKNSFKKALTFRYVIIFRENFQTLWMVPLNTRKLMIKHFQLRLFVPENWFLLKTGVLWLLVPLCSNSKIYIILSAVLFIYVIGVTITLLVVFSLYLEM